MKNILSIFTLLLIHITLFSVEIYDIQYTTDPGDGTYPSPYSGQIVTTSGLVTATNYHNGRFFISSATGGAWNGIFIYSNDFEPSIGDSLELTGEVYEYNGFTEIKNITQFQIISSGNALPAPTIISPSQLNSEEAFESVIVELQDVYVASEYDQYNDWTVTDNFQTANIASEIFYNMNEHIPLVNGYPFSQITGVVNYSYGEYRLNPRSLDDFSSNENGEIISTDQTSISQGEILTVPINISFFGSDIEVSTYHFSLTWDPEILSFVDYDTNETLSTEGSISFSSSTGSLDVYFAGDFSFNNTEKLIKLQFLSLAEGVSTPNFSSFLLNNNAVNWFATKPIVVFPSSVAIGDTITVIMRPLQNIPIITTAESDFTIECKAPPTTNNWNAELIRENTTVPLMITQSAYNYDLHRWFLTTHIPQVEIFELYDLHVTADNLPDDTTTNSVCIINSFRNNYSFIHITDTHLPTHLFSDNEQSLSDSTEMDDLREVINDINIIHPAFVLITGDLVNEGELEDYQNRRYFTKAQRILKELEVPFYLVSGNHDLGGWDDTPPPAGTSRSNWWKFFGWNYLENPPASAPYHTQNYAFTYGQTHFIGMEAYINYDSFMYNIYGGESFTSLQMQWLLDDLGQTTATNNVLFYHYDFSVQLDLENMGIDMTLWGHIHSNSGSINQTPYNLATAATCDGTRAYRIIKVNNNVLHPQNTIYAGDSGENLDLSFTPSNTGIADSVFAQVINLQNIDFQNAQIKFIMPSMFSDFSIENGILEQIDLQDEETICYVSLNIPANGSINVTCVGRETSASTNTISPNYQLSNFPNPFNPSTTFQFLLPSTDVNSVKISIFNPKGQRVKVLEVPDIKTGLNSIVWNGDNDFGKPVNSGIYEYRFLLNNRVTDVKKCLLIK